MSTLLWGHLASGEVAAEERDVRRTTDPVQPDKAPAEAAGAPDWNEVETDSDPNLGMVTRQVASDWHDRERSAPSWAPDVSASHQHNNLIDRQVSSSGTAAAREEAGQFGHGSMSYAVGIEPTIHDGSEYGNDYFAAAPREGVNPNSDPATGVQPTIVSRDEIAPLAGYGMTAARDAASAGLYKAFYDGGQ